MKKKQKMSKKRPKNRMKTIQKIHFQCKQLKNVCAANKKFNCLNKIYIFYPNNENSFVDEQNKKFSSTA